MAYIGAAPDGQGSAERFIFTATGSTTDTVTHNDDGLAINYEANHVSVYLNGVKQVVGTDVTASNGSTLVFASNLSEDDVVECIALSSYSPADTVPASGGTFSGNPTVPTPTASGHAVTKAYSDLKAPIASPTFTGVPATPTASAATNTTQVASTAFVRTEVTNLVDSAPGALDTLNELAAALGDDAAFSTTVTNSIALKAPIASPTFTGTVTLAAGVDLETSTTGKVKQKGAFMQSSTHQAWVMGG
jgi:hypothetical protein